MFYRILSQLVNKPSRYNSLVTFFIRESFLGTLLITVILKSLGNILGKAVGLSTRADAI